MDIRTATAADLPRLRDMYRDIAAGMAANGVAIWDESYPYGAFPADIRDNRLYLLEEGDELLAAFSIGPPGEGDAHVTWEDGRARALYLQRLGVSVRHLRRGVGQAAIRHAVDLARDAGAGYLRLFVVEGNTPAINLYQKAGFTQADGVYIDALDDTLILRELGFERRTAR